MESKMENTSPGNGIVVRHGESGMRTRIVNSVYCPFVGRAETGHVWEWGT